MTRVALIGPAVPVLGFVLPPPTAGADRSNVPIARLETRLAR